MKTVNYSYLLWIFLFACQPTSSEHSTNLTSDSLVKISSVKPLIISDTAAHDTDDPAIWVHPDEPSLSLVIGTDKDENGALLAYNLEGKIVKAVKDLKRPNNVDIEYGFQLGAEKVDIAVCTERLTHKIRIFSLPDLKPIDGGGIEVFQGETQPEFRDLMGIALFKNPKNGEISVIVGRKNGPRDETYLWQYALKSDKNAQISAQLLRKFGAFSGQKEIEAIAVDDALGYVYYSDEGQGIRKYYADPEQGNQELAFFGTEGFADDHEGISIYTLQDGRGYILVSDQQANQFRVFPREGESEKPHSHPLIKIIKTQTKESDGSEVSNVSFSDTFPKGLFVAMSDDKTFQFYSWADLAGEDLLIAPNGLEE